MKIEKLDRKKLEETIIEEKLKGTPDHEIGRKYGISFRFLEKIITKTQGVSVSSLKIHKKIKAFFPKDFKEETTTVWSFPQRGNWATHSGEYRGNWSPYIPRNVILKYSNPGDLVLDYFCGAGTTAVECKLLGRKCIAFDINENAIKLATKNLDFKIPPEQLKILDCEKRIEIFEPELFVGDARDLSFLADNSVDLICSHPPYANAIHYTAGKEGDLSYCNVEEFLEEMLKVAKESFRVLKPGKKCSILIGDIRRKKHVIPLGFKLISLYLEAGFKLREIVIKRQHKCKTTGFWYEKSIRHNFLLLAHEYLPVFEKPEKEVQYNILEEDEAFYIQNFPQVLKTKIKMSPDKLETTTVWILPAENFENLLDKNIIDRYSTDRKYFLITFDNSYKPFNLQNASLIFIKNSCFKVASVMQVDSYLESLKRFIDENLEKIKKGGFLVIQTHDIRVNGLLEPMAKKILDKINKKILWLKEIIIVTKEKNSSYSTNNTVSKDLEIVHQYLIVYEVVK
ncbi:MAG: DNA methyltransferase [Thermodesulfovibrio sp.]|nr:DNA methyltransferase [Thermodesulfovibrio sp.]